MKRKIVRGGSWKDVAHNVRSDLRMWEYQNEQRSYITYRQKLVASGKMQDFEQGAPYHDCRAN